MLMGLLKFTEEYELVTQQQWLLKKILSTTNVFTFNSDYEQPLCYLAPILCLQPLLYSSSPPCTSAT